MAVSICIQTSSTLRTLLIIKRKGRFCASENLNLVTDRLARQIAEKDEINAKSLLVHLYSSSQEHDEPGVNRAL
jgi:hypothetical protein